MCVVSEWLLICTRGSLEVQKNTHAGGIYGVTNSETQGYVHRGEGKTGLIIAYCK